VPWINQDLLVFHGTTLSSAVSIRMQGVQLSLCRKLSDFSLGFYTTSIFRQAADWANKRYRALARGGPNVAERATVVGWSIDRGLLAAQSDLVFVQDSSDYYDFVAYCRSGSMSHMLGGGFYDVVYGPVSLAGGGVLAGADQVSFHTQGALALLQAPRYFFAGTPLL
jgi:hypothetical protein